MNEEIIHRLFYVVVWCGGFFAFWQITKHMPNDLYKLLVCITVMSLTVLCVMPIAMLIEFVLGGNIDTTMMFVAGLTTVSLLSAVWMVMVESSRALQGKKQYQYVIL